MKRHADVTLVEACRIVRLPYLAAWKLIVSGRVAARREGRAWFVNPSELRRVADTSYLVPPRPAA